MSPYVRGLRAKIGTDLLEVPTVSVIVIDHSGRVLLVRHVEGNLWTTPGGMIASKPYVSSGASIDRMSDYCGRCRYDVKQKTGPDACPFNALYWHFLARHERRFAANPRMGNMYATWNRMTAEKRAAYLESADAFLDTLQPADPGWARET